MHYQEFEPGDLLATCVERFWTLTAPPGELEGIEQPILPDGRSEVVIHFGAAFERLTAEGRCERQPLTIFAGQLTSQLVLRPTGSVGVLGVRFRPFGAACLVDVPQHRVAGCTPDVADLSPRLARALRQVQSMTDDPVAAVPVVRRILERVVDRSRLDARLSAATAAVLTSDGAVPIERLADLACMSRRHLERRFLDDIGVTPKRLARIARFQLALRALQEPPPRSGAITAAECGYADQPHFIREFHRLAGCSPSDHLLRQASITGFFISRPASTAV